METEQKSIPFELKEMDEEEGTFEGYAATFSETPDSYGDIIDPGAFKKTLKEAGKRVKVLWNHDAWEPIGVPIEMEEDEKGLRFKAKLSLGVQRAREVLSLMKDGVVTEMSIGYYTIKELWDSDAKIRHLQEIRLWDVSPVTFAANPEATIVGVKAEAKPYPNEHACRLRDPGDFEEGSFRRITRTSGGKKYAIIMGRLKGEDTLTEQAYRYKKEVWSEDEARAHCGEHDGRFEPASDDDKSGRVLSSSNIAKVRSAIEALQALLEAAESDSDDSDKSEPDPSTLTPEGDEEDAEGAAEMEAAMAKLEAITSGFDDRSAKARIEAILAKINTGGN